MTQTPPPGPPTATQSPTEAQIPSPIEAAIASGYVFDGSALELSGLMLEADTLAPIRVRIPVAMLNRHGLAAGGRWHRVSSQPVIPKH